MQYKIEIPEFEGPFDLLLHLIKQANLNIQDICIEEITKQYLEYINLMEELNLNIASEYLVMAAELIEIKSFSLLPQQEIGEDDYEEDPKENLINRLLEYEKYKNLTTDFKEMEKYRQEIYTRDPNSLCEYKEEKEIDYGVSLQDLLDAFSKFMKEQELNKPLNTKITNKEYSVGKKCLEIKSLLKKKKKVEFKDLFESFDKQVIVVTFLAILSMTRKQEIVIEQESNFRNIIIKEKGEV